jgi:hypothetical protein
MYLTRFRYTGPFSSRRMHRRGSSGLGTAPPLEQNFVPADCQQSFVSRDTFVTGIGMIQFINYHFAGKPSA